MPVKVEIYSAVAASGKFKLTGSESLRKRERDQMRRNAKQNLNGRCKTDKVSRIRKRAVRESIND